MGIYVTLIPASALLAAWSFGLSAWIRKKYDPALPPWMIVISSAAAIIGVLILIGVVLRKNPGQRFIQILSTSLFVILGATVFGGIYWWAAGRIARNREPWITILLGIGLGFTIFGFGIATKMEPSHMLLVFAGALLGLIIMRLADRKMRTGLFRFGVLHLLTFFAAMITASIENEHRHLNGGDHFPKQETQSDKDR